MPSEQAAQRQRDVRVLASHRTHGDPVGSVYRILLLAGLRLNEAAQLSWPEVTATSSSSRRRG